MAVGNRICSDPRNSYVNTTFSPHFSQLGYSRTGILLFRIATMTICELGSSVERHRPQTGAFLLAFLPNFAAHLHCYSKALHAEVRWFSELTFLNKEICDVGVVADLIKAFGLY